MRRASFRWIYDVEAPEQEAHERARFRYGARCGAAHRAVTTHDGAKVTSTLSPIIVSRLEKVATDNGFDQELERECGWLVFASTQCPLRVWLGEFGDAVFLAAFSQQNVAHALGEYGTPMAAPLAKDAVAGRTVPDVPMLHGLLRRAFQHTKALPNELLHTFEKKVASLPKTTEAERLVVQRVGQNLFRDGLLDLWEGRCAVTGPPCRSFSERATSSPGPTARPTPSGSTSTTASCSPPHLDAAFDRGFITVADDCIIVVSDALDGAARATLGLDQPLRVGGLAESHRMYLPWHRERVFRTSIG